MKTATDDLAILGGQPMFQEHLHVGRPNVADRDRFLDLINDALDSKWLTNNGPLVQKFEQTIAAAIGVRHCIALCNATIALEIAIRALELKGEVIVPSFTFIATAHALQWQEITPVFCDIDPTTCNIDPGKIEALITPRTTGIIGVHLWGRACDTSALEDIAQRRGLKLLYDAAHAFGCTHQGRMIGHFGDAEVFSFHATKFLNACEGGAIVTNNDELAEKIRLMKNFGFAGYDRVIYIGTNGKMTEISAAMGLSNLERMNDIIAVNDEHYKTYCEELSNVDGVSIIRYAQEEKNNYQYIVVDIDEAVTGIDRDSLLKILHKENVLARRYFFPGCHNMEPYKSFFPHAKLLLPVTEEVIHRLISLPTGMSLTKDDIKDICHLIRFVVQNGTAIKQSIPKA